MNKPLHEQLHLSIREIDELLLQIIQTDSELQRPSLLYSSIEKLILAGGKRLRPLMAIVGGRFGMPEKAHLSWKAAGLLEYMHMASLIHDDIIDESELRRGEQALHAATDIGTAVHAGNYMLARALEWSSADDSIDDEFYMGAELAALITELCIGEYNQLQHRFDFDMGLEHYIEKTKRKTALLMGACMSAGARAAGADEETAKRLYTFGESVGIAFQIQDDILDFTASSKQLGKPAGADLRSGQITLPVLYALQDAEAAPIIRSLHINSSEQQFAKAVDAVLACGGIEKSKQLAASYTQEADRIIKLFSDHPSCKDLQVLANYFTQKNE